MYWKNMEEPILRQILRDLSAKPPYSLPACSVSAPAFVEVPAVTPAVPAAPTKAPGA